MEAERWKQVDELLQSALLLPSEQRDEFLRQACAGDTGLEQEVRSLLASDQSAGGFLEGPAINDAAQMIELNEVREAGDAALGQTFSHYRVLKKLGSGGMGAVYEAEDLRLGRHVALKLLLESQATSSKALQRFEQEARAISSLNHPNICTLYEVEEYQAKPVIVMELLEGQTLKERMKAGRVSLTELLQWGIDVADALDAAHATGLVHRDIKPANLFITSRGRAKVLDFGLAKLSTTMPGTARLQDDSLTSLGVIPGTTPYMSPEQVRGDDLDGRTDIFSLGTVLYEMATGQRPFAEKNLVLTMDAVLNKRPVPVTQVNPEIPAELEQIIEKALEKDLNLRYQSAGELHADLNHLKRDTDSGHVTAGSPGNRVLHEARKTRARILWKFVAPALLLATLVAGGLYYRSHQTKSLTDKDTIILADFTNTTGDPVFDGTLRQGLAAQLEQSPFVNLISDERIAQTLALMTQPKDARLTYKLASEVCQRTASAATIEGSISSLGSQYVLGLKAVDCRTGDPLANEQVTTEGKERVLKALGVAAAKMRAKLGESLSSVQKYDTPPEKVTTASLEALNAYSLGLKARHEKGDIPAIPFFRRAIELDPNFAMAHLTLGKAYYNMGAVTEAIPSCEKAFTLRKNVSAREDFEITSEYHGWARGDLRKADEIYQQWAQTYPQDTSPLDLLGNDYLWLGRYPEALDLFLEEKRRARGGYYNYYNLVWAYLSLNRVSEARQEVEQGLARRLETDYAHRALYFIDFLEADSPGMQRELAWAAGRPGLENSFLDLQSDTEAYYGHRQEAWAFSQKAVAAARHDNAHEEAAVSVGNVALREAEFGNSARALKAADSALALLPSKNVRILVALADARAGSAKLAQSLANELAKANPSDTLLNFYWLPTIRAAAELDLDHPAQAIAILQGTSAYELGQPLPLGPGTLYPVYVRGQAYLQLGQASKAATEYQKLLDHPGCVMNYPFGALAHLQLGRAYALAGDKTQARTAYQDFLTLWKNADPDIPILKQAKAEYAKLK
jgi:serine/threonine protein kinase